MVKSNEFSGNCLSEAVRAATAAYEKPEITKSFCTDIKHEYNVESRKLDRLLYRITDLQRIADNLEAQARLEALASLVTLFALAIRNLKFAARLINRLRRPKLRNDTKRELDDIVPDVASALLAAGMAMAQAKSLDAARELSREIDGLRAEYEQIANNMISLAESYERGNCHLSS